MFPLRSKTFFFGLAIADGIELFQLVPDLLIAFGNIFCDHGQTLKLVRLGAHGDIGCVQPDEHAILVQPGHCCGYQFLVPECFEKCRVGIRFPQFRGYESIVIHADDLLLSIARHIAENLVRLDHLGAVVKPRNRTGLAHRFEEFILARDGCFCRFPEPGKKAHVLSPKKFLRFLDLRQLISD